MLAGEGERLAAPQAVEDRQGLVEHRRPAPDVDLVAEVPELGPRRPAETDPQDEPALAQPVERGRRAGQHPRPLAGHGRHHRAQPDPEVAWAMPARAIHGSANSALQVGSTRT